MHSSSDMLRTSLALFKPLKKEGHRQRGMRHPKITALVILPRCRVLTYKRHRMHHATGVFGRTLDTATMRTLTYKKRKRKKETSAPKGWSSCLTLFCVGCGDPGVAPTVAWNGGTQSPFLCVFSRSTLFVERPSCNKRHPIASASQPAP